MNIYKLILYKRYVSLTHQTTMAQILKLTRSISCGETPQRRVERYTMSTIQKYWDANLPFRLVKNWASCLEWSPVSHRLFPSEFRHGVRHLLLVICRSERLQKCGETVGTTIGCDGLKSQLPLIISHIGRKWEFSV